MSIRETKTTADEAESKNNNEEAVERWKSQARTSQRRLSIYRENCP